MISDDEIAEAAAQNSIEDLVFLARECTRPDASRSSEGGSSSRLTKINDALQQVITRLEQALVQLETQKRLENLAGVLEAPDSPELRPAVEAAATTLLARGPAGREVLLARASVASETMRLWVSTVFERNSDFAAARRLRGEY